MKYAQTAAWVFAASSGVPQRMRSVAARRRARLSCAKVAKSREGISSCLHVAPSESKVSLKDKYIVRSGSTQPPSTHRIGTEETAGTAGTAGMVNR
jgi:hypothetical protein